MFDLVTRDQHFIEWTFWKQISIFWAPNHAFKTHTGTPTKQQIALLNALPIARPIALPEKHLIPEVHSM